jgi:hypothetical protein
MTKDGINTSASTKIVSLLSAKTLLICFRMEHHWSKNVSDTEQTLSKMRQVRDDLSQKVMIKQHLPVING